jgi:hypothetical protein
MNVRNKQFSYLITVCLKKNSIEGKVLDLVGHKIRIWKNWSSLLYSVCSKGLFVVKGVQGLQV